MLVFIISQVATPANITILRKGEIIKISPFLTDFYYTRVMYLYHCPMTPAEAVQIDWGEATVVLCGIKQKIQIWCMRECHSGDIFVSAFYRQNEESFLEGIVKGLEHFGGTPQKIIFD